MKEGEEKVGGGGGRRSVKNDPVPPSKEKSQKNKWKGNKMSRKSERFFSENALEIV